MGAPTAQRIRTPAAFKSSFLAESDREHAVANQQQQAAATMMTGNGPDEPDEATLKDAAEAPETPQADDNADVEDATLPSDAPPVVAASPTEALKEAGSAAPLKPIPQDSVNQDMMADSASSADDSAPTPLAPLHGAVTSIPNANEDRFVEAKAHAQEPASKLVPVPDGGSGSSDKPAFKIPDMPASVNVKSLTRDTNRVRKCVGSHDKGCVASWDPNSIKWTTKTVPRGTFKHDPTVNPKKGGSDSTSAKGEEKKFFSTANNAASSDDQAPLLSKNPKIRSLEQAYYKKKKELDTEEKWVKLVRETIKEYELKVAKVQSHIWRTKGELTHTRRNIILAIKKEKEDKLAAELRAALKSIHKLNGHSAVLGSKLGALTKQKLDLAGTIARIKNALGVSDVSAYLPKEQKKQKDPYKPVGNTMRFRERMAANDEAKSVLQSLADSVSGVPVSEHTVVVHDLPSQLDAMPIEHRIRVEEKLRENMAVADDMKGLDRITKEYLH